ncbi:MAG: GNAT family N-acetyltransferase [Stellaceae bacterium]
MSFAAGAGLFLPYRSLPLAGDGAAMAATCAAMAEALIDRLRSRLGLRMGPVSAQDPMCNALVAALRRYGWDVGTLPAGHAFVVALPDTVPKFERINAGLVRRINYYERRLHRAGKPDIVRYGGSGGSDWELILSRVAAIEQNSWVAKNNGTMLFAIPTARRFWDKVLSDEFLSSCVTIWLLYLDGRPISFSCGLDIGNVKFILANLYDEAFKTYRCGNILTRHVLTGAIEGGQRRVD